MGREKSDEELEKILKSFSKNELYGLKFGLLPEDKTPKDLTIDDVVRLMEINPEEHY